MVGEAGAAAGGGAGGAAGGGAGGTIVQLAATEVALLKSFVP